MQGGPGLEAVPSVSSRCVVGDPLERIACALERIAAALERRGETLPPEALDKETASRFIGVDVATIEHLIRTRKLEYVQHGAQRGRVVPVKSLRRFLKEYRQPAEGELPRRQRRA